MEEVKAYEVSDGFLTTDKKVAEKREEDIRFRKTVEEIIEDNGWNGMDKDEVVSMMVENKEKFRKIFGM